MINSITNNNCPNDQEEIAFARRFVLDWKQVQLNGTHLSEYEAETIKVIENFLGYLPIPIIYFSHEVFIRALVAGFHQGNFSEDVLVKEVGFHAKRIRNEDLQKHGFAKRYLTDDDYFYHATHLAQFRHLARERLIRFVEFEPLLEHSLQAEVYLRQLFQMDFYYEGMPVTEIDYRAITILDYNKHLSLYGEEAADNSLLLGQTILEQLNVSPYSLKELR